VLNFFVNWIFGSYYDYRFYRIVGVATAAGAEANAEAPRSVINEYFWYIIQKRKWLEWDYKYLLFIVLLVAIIFAAKYRRPLIRYV
jgi:hypothetical protein